MSLPISDELKAVLAQLRAFMDERVVPLEASFLADGFQASEAALDPLREQARAMGLWTPQLAAAEGGPGLGLMAYGLVCEVLGRSPLGLYVFNCQAPDAGNMEVLEKYGSPAQKEKQALRRPRALPAPKHLRTR